MAKRKSKKNFNKVLAFIFCMLLMYLGYYIKHDFISPSSGNTETFKSYDLEEIPEYNGNGYIYLNNNIPNFSDEDKNAETFEYYSKLDNLNKA